MDKMDKANFWNDLQQKYPEQMQDFGNWIDEYKRREDWTRLFNNGLMCNHTPDPYALKSGELHDKGHHGTPAMNHRVKYHDLPNAMQLGIFIQYTVESGSEFPEFPFNDMTGWIGAIDLWFHDRHEGKPFDHNDVF